MYVERLSRFSEGIFLWPLPLWAVGPLAILIGLVRVLVEVYEIDASRLER